ncbi:MAG: ATP-binding protein [Oscillospiraceae bacterium]
MKVITEAMLREELKDTMPEIYYVAEDKILSPAAKEYLAQKKIKFQKGSPPTYLQQEQLLTKELATAPTAKYTDYISGGFYEQKPEHMTQLYANFLVAKNHPRIIFRGKLDSLQAQFVLVQTELDILGESKLLIEDLEEILGVLREIMRCDVMEEAFVKETIIGFTIPQLREYSHNPMKFFNVKYMLLPDYKMGKAYALLNSVRTAVRECEIAAVTAFYQNGKITRNDIVQTLNRLSSTLHIMMCKYLAGEYKKTSR